MTSNGYTSSPVSAGNSSCLNPPLNIDLAVYGCVPVGIEEQQSNFIKIYPNPFTNQLNINSSEEISNIQLLDLTGRILINKKVTSEFNSKINISNINSGQYILIIETTSGVYEKKVFKK